MAKEIEIKVLVGRKTTLKAGEVVGHTSAMAPVADVTGQTWREQIVQCWSCGGISYVNFDIISQKRWVCNFCGAPSELSE